MSHHLSHDTSHDVSQNMGDDDENVDYELPDKAPSWMLFFEGTLYRRYLNYLNQHDFSQILNNKVSLDESFYAGKSFYTDFPSINDNLSDFPTTDLPEKNKDFVPPEVLRVTSTTSDKFLSESDRKRRIRRTRCLICFGIFCIAAIAAAAALVIHFVFIIKDKDPVKDSDLIYIGNGTINATDLTDVMTNVTDSVDVIGKTLSESHGELGDIEKELTLLEPTQPSEQPDNIIMSDGPFFIGEKEKIFTCKITELKDWKSVYMTGSKIHVNQTSVLNFNISRDLKSNIVGKRDKITVRIRTYDERDEMHLTMIYKIIECEDQENFICGLENKDGTVSRGTTFIVSRKPTSSVNMVIPDEVVSGKLLRISASWEVGYPEPWGNISWSHVKDGTTHTEDLQITKQFWKLKKDRNICKTTMDSYINFTPSMKANGSEIIARVVLKDERKTSLEEVKEAVNSILVVPEDHCHGINNDTNIAHPYTCAKFVRCLEDKMVVYACPNDTCFTEESGQCDNLSNTTDEVAVS